MAEELHIASTEDKREKYEALLPQVKALIESEENLIANLANISAAIRQTFSFLWTGFYIVESDELVLGPFQGPIACTRIKFGKGVCGTSWKEKKTIIVDDVDNFPGHIACSSLSKSEIVVPIFDQEGVRLILDVDSEKICGFDEIDREYLEKISDLLTKKHFS